MPLLPKHPRTFTSRVYRNPILFAADHPDYAGVARELVRLRPDCRSLRFDTAWISERVPQDGNGIDTIEIALESPGGMVHVTVWNTAAGLVADTL